MSPGWCARSWRAGFLQCNLCSLLLDEAAIVTCCGESFCHKCITDSLVDRGWSCPKCFQSGIGIDAIIPDKRSREAVALYLKEKHAEHEALVAQQHAEHEKQRKQQTEQCQRWMIG